jgi:hypothetical protein
MLVDRIRVFEGRSQLYGTQYDWDESLRFMEPTNGIADPDRLEERRRQVGLPPMRWRQPPPPDEPPPADHALRQREAREWARRVGWIEEPGEPGDGPGED